jgi:putrescine aminotransferase
MKKLDKTGVIENFGRYVSAGKVKFFQQFGLEFVPGKREGCFLFDLEGKAFLNCHCNGGVFNLGHRHPKIIAATRMAMEMWDMGNHHLISAPRAMLGARLAELLPGDINRTVFGVSGGEAIDLAIKLARGYTGKPGIISALGGYHGHTGFAMAAGDEQFKKPFEPMPPGFTQVKFNDLNALQQAINADTAAVLFETIPATLGIYVPNDDYFKGVRELCARFGALLIIDEVQTGLGRTGKLWGIEHYNIVPDIIVLGKGLSGGIYPMAATCYRDKLDSFFEQNPFIHISTCGGSEIGCFTTLAVLDETTSPGLLEHVNEMTDFYHQALNELKKRFPHLLIEIRQKGLMMGLKFPVEKISLGMCKMLYDNGLFMVYSGNDATVVQFLPPLIITQQEAEFTIEALEKSLVLMNKMIQ